MKDLKKKSLYSIERIAIKATRFIGSTESLIIHTTLFIASFVLYFFGIPFQEILLVVTTIVSLEAIYLSIFIQMSVNRQDEKLNAVALDIDEIQEDVEGIEKDIDEIQEDVDELNEEEEIQEKKDADIMSRVEDSLGNLIEEVYELKKENKTKKIVRSKLIEKVIELKKENEIKEPKKKSTKKSNK